MTRRGAQEDSEGALSGTVREGQQEIGALVWHAVILSGAKNLALDFSVEKRQGEMLRCAQHDSEGALSRRMGAHFSVT
jgi:HAMP domain-containing protein